MDIRSFFHRSAVAAMPNKEVDAWKLWFALGKIGKATAREIAKVVEMEKHRVNQILYGSPELFGEIEKRGKVPVWAIHGHIIEQGNICVECGNGCESAEEADACCGEEESVLCELCKELVDYQDYAGCCTDGLCPSRVERMCNRCAVWDNEKEVWFCDACVKKEDE